MATRQSGRTMTQSSPNPVCPVQQTNADRHVWLDRESDAKDMMCRPCGGSYGHQVLYPLEEGDDDDGGPNEESYVGLRSRSAHPAPTRAEKEEHDKSHIPYRSWCPFCVAGRRDSPAHVKHGSERPEGHEVGLD